MSVTEASNWYIGIQPTQDDGITLDYDKRNGSRDGAGPNTTYIYITKKFDTAGTNVIAKARFYKGDDFLYTEMETVDIKVYIIKVDIEHPAGEATTVPCYHYDHQVVTPGSPEPYTLDEPDPGIKGKIEPAGFEYKWTLDAACGMIPDVNDSHPRPHTTPATAGTGKLTLEAYHGGTATGCKDEQDIEVYRDHLERDIKNFDGKKSGTVGGFYMTPPTPGVPVSWVCHQSASHAYDGVVRNDEWFPSAGFAQQGSTSYTDASGSWTLPAGVTLQRHDVVAYYGSYGDPASENLTHSQILLNSTTTWAANNESIYPHADQGKFVTRGWDHYSKNRFIKIRYVKIWRK